MRAAVYRSTGPAAAVLEIAELADPEPGPGQVRVRIAVSAVNPTDVKIRSGLTPRPIAGVQVPHMDGAGVIDRVGAGVDGRRVGERVWVMLAAHDNGQGTAAEYCVVRADRAILLPEGVSFACGATLGVPAVTAAHCLIVDGPVSGLDVLVAGGAGAVGRCAVQLAHWAGARVAATASSPQKMGVARAAGAELVVDYRAATAAEELLAWTRGFSRIVEVSLAANAALDAQVAAPRATVVVYAADGGDPVLPARPSLLRALTYRYVLLYALDDTEMARAVETVMAALAAGALDLPPATSCTLEEVATAHEAVERHDPSRALIQVADLGP